LKAWILDCGEIKKLCENYNSELLLVGIIVYKQKNCEKIVGNDNDYHYHDYLLSLEVK